MRGLIIIFGFDGAGWLLHEGAGVPLPSHVLGLLLLAASLFLGLVKLEWVETAASVLTRHMMLFFVPLLAGVSVFAPLLGDSWPIVAVSVVAGTATVALLTGYVTSLFTRERRKEAPVSHEQQHSVF